MLALRRGPTPPWDDGESAADPVLLVVVVSMYCTDCRDCTEHLRCISVAAWPRREADPWASPGYPVMLLIAAALATGSENASSGDV